MPTITIRLVMPAEIEPAVRLLLETSHGPVDAAAVRAFIADANVRGLPLNEIHLAVEATRLVWTVWPIAGAGRTGVLIEPNRRLPRGDPAPIARLIRLCCERLAGSGVQIVQTLLDPDDAATARLHFDCGFEDLARLDYLRLPVRPSAPRLPTGWTLRSAPPDDDVAVALQESYAGTLDCPRLNGLRSLADVIAGYRHAHPYDPSLWHVVYEAARPAGILLLSQPGPGEALELSYLGLSVESRGRGVGDVLVKQAQYLAAATGSPELAVSVDSRNTPARRLYFRNGGRQVWSRRVMIQLPERHIAQNSQIMSQQR